MPGALAVPAEVRCHWKLSASLSPQDEDNWFQTWGFKNHYLLQMYFLHYTFTSDTDNTDTFYEENNEIKFL